MESVKSIVKDVVYGKSKIHTNMEFTFSNNIFVSFAEMSLQNAILYSIIVDILDGSVYLFDKEAPERVSASERLARTEQPIASVEKDGVEGIQTEVDKNSLDGG